METTYLRDLIVRGLAQTGANATQQDYDDALRAVCDAEENYHQCGDELGGALAHHAQIQLLAARCRKEPCVPY